MFTGLSDEVYTNPWQGAWTPPNRASFHGWFKHPFQGCTNQIHTFINHDSTRQHRMGLYLELHYIIEMMGWRLSNHSLSTWAYLHYGIENRQIRTITHLPYTVTHGYDP